MSAALEALVAPLRRSPFLPEIVELLRAEVEAEAGAGFGLGYHLQGVNGREAQRIAAPVWNREGAEKVC